MFKAKHLRPEKVKLTGFNNLQKSLSFNLYDFAVAATQEQKESYAAYIYDRFSAEKIGELLKKIVDEIEAETLDVSVQDYEPYGASAMVLMGDIKGGGDNPLAHAEVQMHLDKSHICAHTYPDFTEPNGIVSFRVDIELSTCGEITPLTALNSMFRFFDTDMVTIDYVVRGFTRDVKGRRIYMDHTLNSIRDYIDPAILESYECRELMLQNDNIWQLKMLRTDMPIEEYFAPDTAFSDREKKRYIKLVRKEMQGLFHNWRE